MNKYDVENYLYKAKDVVEKVLLSENENKDISGYRNKISSFSTMTVMNGLLVALAYYNKNDPNIVKLFAEKEGLEADAYFNKLLDLKRNENEEELAIRTEDALTFATSLKLVLNLYKKKDNSDGD